MKKKLFLLADEKGDNRVKEEIKTLETYGYEIVIAPNVFSATEKNKKSIKTLLTCNGVVTINYCNYDKLLLDVAKSCGLKVYNSNIWITKAKKENIK